MYSSNSSDDGFRECLAIDFQISEATASQEDRWLPEHIRIIREVGEEMDEFGCTSIQDCVYMGSS